MKERAEVPEVTTTETRSKFELAGCAEVHASTVIEGLATLTAFTNGAVKAQFLDRTIVRMHADLEWVQVLSNKGEEATYRLAQVT